VGKVVASIEFLQQHEKELPVDCIVSFPEVAEQGIQRGKLELLCKEGDELKGEDGVTDVTAREEGCLDRWDNTS
jgi:hypothetical protein